MSKKISIIGSLVLASFLIVSIFVFPAVKNSYASITTRQASLQSAVALPQSAEIIKKVHSNKIKDIISKSKNPQQDVNDYINTLNKDDLLLSIAEVSNDLKDSSNITELGMFADAVKQKLMGKLTNEDYESILTNVDYSDVFKLYSIDLKTSENYNNKIKNDKTYNKLLRQMSKDENIKSSLRLVSLVNVDDYTVDDIPELETFIDSENSSYIKANTLRIIKRLDKAEGNKFVLEILKHINQYSEVETNSALDTLGDYTKESEKISSTEDEIDLINDVINTTNNQNIINSTVFALGHFKNEKSINTVLKNRLKINDDKLIRFYIDENYLIVENMLNSNDDSLVNAAITCVEIAPFEDFLPKILELEKTSINKDMKIRLDSLISLINISNIKRNVKWDGEYK